MLKELRRHHAVDLRGAGQKHLAPRRLEPRQHGLEQMHVRVLLALSRVGGQNAVIASGRRLEALIENPQCGECCGKEPRLGRELVGPGESEQSEGVGVEIALRVMNGAVGMNGKDPAVVAVAPMIAVDQPVRGFERDRRALRAPADERRMREDIDLARLHHRAPRRGVERLSFEGEALDEASARRIESRFAPERQRLLDHPALEARSRALRVPVSGDVSAPVRQVNHGAHNTSPTSP